MKRILTPGEKIMNLRKTLGLTQKELAGEQLSRSVISQIENGTKIYSNAASIITKKINQKIKELKLDIPYINVEYLTETDNEQIERLINEYIEELGYSKHSENRTEAIIDKLKDIKDFSETYDIGDKNRLVILNKVIDILLLDVQCFEAAHMYSLKGMEISIKLQDYESVVKYISKLIASKIFLNEYKSVISLAKYAFNIIEEHNVIDITYVQKIIYNVALAYRKLGNYEESLKYLNKLKNYSNLNKKQLIDIQNLTGKDMFKLKNYNKAEEILIQAKNEANENGYTNELIAILENLCLLYIEKDNMIEALKYADMIESFKDDISNQVKYARNIYYLMIIETKLDRLEYVTKNYIEAINKVTSCKNGEMQYNLIKEIASYFILKNSIKDLNFLVKKINLLYKNKEILNKNIAEVLHEIAEYYFEIKIDIKECRNICKLAINITRVFNHCETYDV